MFYAAESGFFFSMAAWPGVKAVTGRAVLRGAAADDHRD
jgi:hypothetical protein